MLDSAISAIISASFDAEETRGNHAEVTGHPSAHEFVTDGQPLPNVIRKQRLG